MRKGLGILEQLAKLLAVPCVCVFVASKGGISIETFRNMGAQGPEVMRVRLDTLMAGQSALEDAGVDSFTDDGGGPGVRLRRS